MKMPTTNLTGKIFGDYKVLRFSKYSKHRMSLWLCRCSCWVDREVLGSNLCAGRSQSCGCKVSIKIKVRNTTHGLTKTKVHRTWTNVKQRCLNPSEKDKKYYSGKKLCVRWEKFENFLKDMGHPPSGKHSIDRIDGRKGYSKSNCRWATPKEQINNRILKRRV